MLLDPDRVHFSTIAEFVDYRTRAGCIIFFCAIAFDLNAVLNDKSAKMAGRQFIIKYSMHH
jgi:hypothetical protein